MSGQHDAHGRHRARRHRRRGAALLGVATLATLAWPGPASSETTLGGYSGTAIAQVVRVQVFDPVIPIPATPQVDGGVAYTRAATDTGPVTRALASYLWPGDVVGDGFGQLVGGDAKYPVQVNSRFPATNDAPARNTAQLTDGNGMTTSSDGDSTTATVTGLGIAGPDTNLVGGLLTGLQQLTGRKPSPSPSSTLKELPVPVGPTLAGLATVQGVKSRSSVVVGAKTITATARAYAAETKLLGGLITVGAMDVTSSTVSDGTRATVSGSATVAGIDIAGVKFALDDKGISLAGPGTAIPAVPKAATDLLARIGIGVDYLQTQRTGDGATGSFAAQGLVITVDTNPLKNALNLGGLLGPLRDLISKIPNLGSQVGPLLNLGPKIVFEIGDVSTTATAAPAFTGDGGTGGGGVPSTGSGGVGGVSAGDSGSGGTPGDTGSVQADTPIDSPSAVAAPPAGGSGPPPLQAASFDLPPLGPVPRLLILGGIVLAAVLGWALRTAGGLLLGGAGSCSYGLTTGVPDLRKG